jgi:hypothetical protein
VSLFDYRISLKEVSLRSFFETRHSVNYSQAVPGVFIGEITYAICSRVVHMGHKKLCFCIFRTADEHARSGTRVVDSTFPCKSTQIEEFRLSYSYKKDLVSTRVGSKSDVITPFSFPCIDGQKMLNSVHIRCVTKLLELFSLEIGETTEPNNVEFIKLMNKLVSY